VEARFIILHPDDSGEILAATALIRCLKTQVDGALVYSVVKKEHLWLLDTNPFLEEVFVFQENPKELIDPLRDFLPDYLIDLDGERKVRRFKNRLKVMDFTINRRNIGDRWLDRAFETCKLFDVHDDGFGQHFELSNSYQEILPGDFLDGYLVLSLDSPKNGRALTDEQIIELVVMIEKPIVIIGTAGDRKLADRIGQSTGCAVFPTCGDFSMSETASVLGHGLGLISFGSVWDQLATALGMRTTVIGEITDSGKLTDTALWARSLFPNNHDRFAV